MSVRLITLSQRQKTPKNNSCSENSPHRLLERSPVSFQSIAAETRSPVIKHRQIPLTNQLHRRGNVNSFFLIQRTSAIIVLLFLKTSFLLTCSVNSILRIHHKITTLLPKFSSSLWKSSSIHCLLHSCSAFFVSTEIVLFRKTSFIFWKASFFCFQ